MIALLAQHMRLQVATAVVVIDDQDGGRRLGHAAPMPASTRKTLSMASISVPDDRSDLDMISAAAAQHGAIFRLQNG